jgi:hypothetical protein
MDIVLKDTEVKRLQDLLEVINLRLYSVRVESDQNVIKLLIFIMVYITFSMYSGADSFLLLKLTFWASAAAALVWSVFIFRAAKKLPFRAREEAERTIQESLYDAVIASEINRLTEPMEL